MYLPSLAHTHMWCVSNCPFPMYTHCSLIHTGLRMDVYMYMYADVVVVCSCTLPRLLRTGMCVHCTSSLPRFASKTWMFQQF